MKRRCFVRRRVKKNAAPRLIISGLRGGSGKTLIALGLARALAQDGLRLKPFKKGPDYIDAAWLGLAARRPASNLDLFFLPPPRLRAFFSEAFAGDGADFALIEGNRGLFDGRDARGSCSTAELARVLRCPLVLVLDCTKMTRTAAALVQGVAAFERDLPLAGVILNRIGSDRHGAQVRRALEQCFVPVLGALPRLRENPLPERHMGLILHADESARAEEAEKTLDILAARVREYLDLERILRLARQAPALPVADIRKAGPERLCSGAASKRGEFSARDESGLAPDTPVSEKVGWRQAVRIQPALPRIGYVRDAALWFYYEENLDALRRAGAELVRLSLAQGRNWPELDGMYLGGGFPEECAGDFAPAFEQLRGYAEKSLPVYAECGGFLLLTQSLEREGVCRPMAGVFPVRARFYERPQGLGYVEAEVTRANPFHPVGTVLRGHEFHYTRCEFLPGARPEATLRLRCGKGMGEGVDGFLHKSVFAAYTHIFAPAVPHWAERFVAAARRSRDERRF